MAIPSRDLRIVAWNLNHRTVEKRLPTHLLPALMSLEPDIIVLNEFVDGLSRAAFYGELSSRGFEFVITERGAKRHNQVLMASRIGSLKKGRLRAPAIVASLPSNVLHGRIDGLNLDILGLRIPDLNNKPPLKRACWEWICESARSLVEAPALILGDLNTDANYPATKGGEHFARLGREGWLNPMPPDGVSFVPKRGTPKRIDHLFGNRLIRFSSARYVGEANGFCFFGGVRPMSDHAVVMVNFACDGQVDDRV